VQDERRHREVGLEDREALRELRQLVDAGRDRHEAQKREEPEH